jgi:isoleucyl-tRNA synthetase
MTEDKLSAYQTLYQCLKTIAQLIAPIAPFYADRLYADLTGSDKSVHLSFFPKADQSAVNPALEKQMQLAQTITSMVLALRRKVNIKVRQPLSTIMVPVVDNQQKEMLEAVRQLVLTEVNVKDIRIVGNDEGILVKRVKPDFKKLGPKHGKQMKAVAAAITSLDNASIAKFEKNGSIDIDVNGQTATIDLADVEIISEDIPGWLVANEGSVTVALDVTITPELQQEGLARDIINRVQNIRKSRNYEITDRINLTFAKSAEIDQTIANFAEYIGAQVLANSVTVVDQLPQADTIETLDIDGLNVIVNITLN